MAERIKITKTTVDKLPLNELDRVVVWDKTLSGFGVRVGRSKVYFVQKKVAGKLIRVTLGKHGDPLTAEQARERAQKQLAKLTIGENPNVEKRQAKARGVTLQKAFDDFLVARKDLKPRTKADYKRFMEFYFKDWQTKPAASITRQMITTRHRLIGKKPIKKGKKKGSKKEGGSGMAQANQCMRFLRSLFNFAIAEYNSDAQQPVIPENPVKALSQTRAWYRVPRRQEVIKTSELPALFDGLEVLGDAGEPNTVRDYITFILFSGLRRGEAARLKWDDADFKEKTFVVTDPKNKKPFTLPLSDYLYQLLKRRYENRVNEYIFAGNGKAGYLIEPKKQVAKIKEKSKLKFTIHDLRRTYITIAESLDISVYAIKALVNHSMGQDVTANYVVPDPERLRKPVEKIAGFILQKAGRSKKAKVIKLHKGKKAG